MENTNKELSPYTFINYRPIGVSKDDAISMEYINICNALTNIEFKFYCDRIYLICKKGEYKKNGKKFKLNERDCANLRFKFLYSCYQHFVGQAAYKWSGVNAKSRLKIIESTFEGFEDALNCAVDVDKRLKYLIKIEPYYNKIIRVKSQFSQNEDKQGECDYPASDLYTKPIEAIKRDCFYLKMQKDFSSRQKYEFLRDMMRNNGNNKAVRIIVDSFFPNYMEKILEIPFPKAKENIR